MKPSLLGLDIGKGCGLCAVHINILGIFSAILCFSSIPQLTDCGNDLTDNMLVALTTQGFPWLQTTVENIA